MDESFRQMTRMQTAVKRRGGSRGLASLPPPVIYNTAPSSGVDSFLDGLFTLGGAALGAEAARRPYSIPLYSSESFTPWFDQLLFDIASRRQQNPSASVQDIKPKVDAMVESLGRDAKVLELRRNLHQAHSALAVQEQQQRADEADLALSPLVSDLAAFIGSQNWAGVYAKRREIMTHPLFPHTREVRKVLAEVDARLKDWGTDFTSTGQEVSFLDVLRMAGSTDPKEQKEAFRILALRSEDAERFIMSLPVDINPDPLFRYQLLSFIRDNPRVSPEQIALYKEMEAAQRKAYMDLFANDPEVLAQVFVSPEYRQRQEALRRAVLFGAPSGSFADWLPAINASDFALDEEALGLIEDELVDRVWATRNYFARQAYEARRYGLYKALTTSAEDRGKERRMKAPNLLSVERPDSTFVADPDWVSGLGEAGKVVGAGLTGAALKKVGQYATSAGASRAASLLGGIFRSALVRPAAAIFASGFAPAALAATAMTAGVAGYDYYKGKQEEEKVRELLRNIRRARQELLASLSGASSLQGAPPSGEAGRGTGGSPLSSFDALVSLDKALQAFNIYSYESGLGMYLDFNNLFGKNQWAAIRRRMLLDPQFRQRLAGSGLLEVFSQEYEPVNFATPPGQVPLVLSASAAQPSADRVGAGGPVPFSTVGVPAPVGPAPTSVDFSAFGKLVRPAP